MLLSDVVVVVDPRGRHQHSRRVFAVEGRGGNAACRKGRLPSSSSLPLYLPASSPESNAPVAFVTSTASFAFPNRYNLVSLFRLFCFHRFSFILFILCCPHTPFACPHLIECVPSAFPVVFRPLLSGCSLSSSYIFLYLVTFPNPWFTGQDR